jgi:uncharacterized membrane protein YcaP (DUF421 family)
MANALETIDELLGLSLKSEQLVVLVGMHWVFSAISQQSKGFSHLIKGNATIIIADGKSIRDEMAKSHMSIDGLHEDLREKGVKSPAEVREDDRS